MPPRPCPVWPGPWPPPPPGLRPTTGASSTPGPHSPGWPVGPLLRRGQILQPHPSRPAQGQGPLCSRQSAAAQGQSPGDSQIPCHLSPSPGHRGLPGLLDRRIHIGLGNALLNHNISIRPRRLSIDRPDPFSRRIHRRDHRLVEIFLNGQGRPDQTWPLPPPPVSPSSPLGSSAIL